MINIGRMNLDSTAWSSGSATRFRNSFKKWSWGSLVLLLHINTVVPIRVIHGSAAFVFHLQTVYGIDYVMITLSIFHCHGAFQIQLECIQEKLTVINSKNNRHGFQNKKLKFRVAKNTYSNTVALWNSCKEEKYKIPTNKITRSYSK